MRRYTVVLCLVFALLLFAPTSLLAADSGWIVTCSYSHSLADDPIVVPGLPGQSHMHDFVGSPTTNAYTTAESLAEGGTTCRIVGDNSAYWSPAMYEDGQLVLPMATMHHTLFYYRRKGAPVGTTVQSIPAGLRFIVGNSHATSPEENPGMGTRIIFKCGPGSGVNLPGPPSSCTSGILVVSMVFPNCWDGKNLDSADHKSHMSFPAGSRCPASHPVVLPRIESFFRYNVGKGAVGEITFASGPYYTIHQDFFNGWDQVVLQQLIDSCINNPIDCGTNPVP